MLNVLPPTTALSRLSGTAIDGQDTAVEEARVVVVFSNIGQPPEVVLGDDDRACYRSHVWTLASTDTPGRACGTVSRASVACDCRRYSPDAAGHYGGAARRDRDPDHVRDPEHMRSYGYKDPNAHRNFRAWLGLLIIGLVILAAGVGVKGSGGMFGGGEGVEIVIMVGGGLAAAFGGLGTVLAGMSLGVTVMRGKMWWR
jgi:hypothetical protein